MIFVNFHKSLLRTQSLNCCIDTEAYYWKVQGLLTRRMPLFFFQNSLNFERVLKYYFNDGYKNAHFDPNCYNCQYSTFLCFTKCISVFKFKFQRFIPGFVDKFIFLFIKRKYKYQTEKYPNSGLKNQ